MFVASAGNEGDAGMGFPAACAPVISVGVGGWTRQWNDYPDKTSCPKAGTCCRTRARGS
ncbi:hypothetical protein [Lentzea indica]|uniref:hypothetical protein n=1 Tax=Lentzea indica TaxID=2604800 RepID=UPI00143968AE|nr:hypothetical protein [Lentzea indica]